MAYETKTLLASIASIARYTRNIEKFYIELEKIANVEGVILGPYDEDADEKTPQQKTEN
jgi:hypothetical protein